MGTKSQKICAALLALAGVAFVVDRWVVGDDKGAAASASEYQVNRTASPTTGPEKQPPSIPANVAAVASGASAQQGTSLASRLAALSEARRLTATGVADAFQASQAWVTANAPPPPAAAPKPEVARPSVVQQKVDHAALFVQRHTLTAVMKDRDGGMAIVNGKLYKVGQYVGGFKLTRVGLTDGSFWGKGSGAKLKLAGQFPATAIAR